MPFQNTESNVRNRPYRAIARRRLNVMERTQRFIDRHPEFFVLEPVAPLSREELAVIAEKEWLAARKNAWDKFNKLLDYLTMKEV